MRPLAILSAAPLLAIACSGAPHAEGPSSDASSSASPDAGAVSEQPLQAGCSAALADGRVAPSRAHAIVPRVPVVPFYQWESNNGYCGEVSLLEAGMSYGQWTSQYNARLLCGAAGNGADAPVGAPLLQTGPAGFCANNDDTPDYNAQLLLEDQAAARASTCMANFGLAGTTYDTTNNTGEAGFEDFLSWVKRQVISGNQVAIGVFEPGGTDEQYDHIVTVASIGTDHDPTDASYYDDDVLTLEDHGANTFMNGQRWENPAIPPGAGSTTPADAGGCTPYLYRYTFGTLPATRDVANSASAPAYSILIPGLPNTQTHTGGNGVGFGPSIVGHDYGFAVSGVVTSEPTYPVALRILRTVTNGHANPASPLAGFDYENPYVGSSDLGGSCTNASPSSWMTMTFAVEVTGLTSGAEYVLYEYDFASVQGVGEAAALDLPTSRFNANASKASHATPFTARGTSLRVEVTRESDVTVAFRAVEASAP